MFFKLLQDSIYQRKIYLFVGTNEEFLTHLKEKYPKKKHKKIVCKDAAGQMYHFKVLSSMYEGVKSRVYYLWSVRFEDTIEDIGSLAHESFHIATTILSDLSVDTSDAEGSESVAYYMESIFKQCLTLLREEAKTKKVRVRKGRKPSRV